MAENKMGLSADEKRFLTLVVAGLNLGPADDAADKLRQRCRRKGLVVFNRTDWCWEITDAGSDALYDAALSAAKGG